MMLLRLDLQFFSGEKTEKATPKKKQDERKKGKVAKSQDVNTAVMLLFCFLGLFVFGGFMQDGMMSMYRMSFTEYINWDLTSGNVQQVFITQLIEAAKWVAPIMGIAMIAGLTANLMQVGFLFTTESLKFDLKKIDPIQGAKRIFAVRAIVELFKSLFKISFIGIITFSIIWMNRDEIMMMSSKTIPAALGFFGNMAIIMGFAATIALLFLGILDYIYQKYDYEKNLRMSKQDIKDEHKNIEGNPLIKQKIREKQRQMAMRRMMSEVPNADVVITNPTHYAIAIKYDENKATAPYIVAKGADEVALRIKNVAKANSVMTVENRPLARALFAAADIGDIIPEEFFQAVAEVLAYVYRVEKKA